MTSIKSSSSETSIGVEYDDFTNTTEIYIGSVNGFRFVNLDLQSCDRLIELITIAKNEIV